MILKILCIIALVPVLFPLRCLFKKQDINLFDLIILFHTLNFVISPFRYGYKLNLDDGIVFHEFIYYISFILMMLVLSLNWHKKHHNKVNIINITKFLRQYNTIKINYLGKLLLAASIVISLVFYLPRATYILHVEEYGVEVDYQTKAAVAMWGAVWDFLGIIFSMSLVLSYKYKKIDKANFVMSLAYFIMLIFFPRRVFLLGMLFLIIVLYSIYREAITKKLLGMLAGFGIAFYLIYFPFYNIMRSSNFMFDTNHPIDSLSEIVSNAIDNWNYRDIDAKSDGATSNRSLGLYTALYDLIKYNPDPKYGELSYDAIDVALPKFLNPNKGDGPEPVLERMTKRYVDQADSFLLHAYGDFHYWGFIFAAFLFGFILFIYNAYARFWKNYLFVNLIPFYISFLMVSLTWNVEGGVNGYLSWFFASLPMLLIILGIEKFKIVQLK